MKLKTALDLMHEGSRLMQMNKSGDAQAWYLVPGGEVSAEIANEIMNRPDVRANEDGLFPGISQTRKMGS